MSGSVSSSAVEPTLPTGLRITRVRREIPGVFTLELDASVLPGGGLAFAPGQYNMLYVFGVGEVPISISGPPAKPGRLVHTIRAVGEVTGAMERLKRGSVVGVRGPYGRGWPLEAARGKDVLIFAGGLGLAPVRSVIYDVLAHREDYGFVEIVYGARTPADLLFRKQLEQWGGRFDVQVHVTVDRAGPQWRGRVGVITGLLPYLDCDPLNTTVFMCGPEVMMRFAARGLQRLGVPDGSIYVSLERNMKCGVRLCGHCQLGPTFVCQDGPVYALPEVAHLIACRQL